MLMMLLEALVACRTANLPALPAVCMGAWQASEDRLGGYAIGIGNAN